MDTKALPQMPPSPAEVGDLILQKRERVQALGWGNREQLYPASQVHEAIAAAYAAGMDRAAEVCGAFNSYQARDCADAIRAAKGE